MKHSIPAVLCCAAFSASASAGLTQFAFEVDSHFVADQATVNLSQTGGQGIAEIPLWMFPALAPEYVSSNGGSGFWIVFSSELEVGEYTLTLLDGFGDGWQDVTFGGDTVGGVLVSNCDTNGFIAAKNFFNGASTSVNFTIVPAPGAIALIGLSALCGNRRRRTA